MLTWLDIASNAKQKAVSSNRISVRFSTIRRQLKPEWALEFCSKLNAERLDAASQPQFEVGRGSDRTRFGFANSICSSPVPRSSRSGQPSGLTNELTRLTGSRRFHSNGITCWPARTQAARPLARAQTKHLIKSNFKQTQTASVAAARSVPIGASRPVILAFVVARLSQAVQSQLAARCCGRPMARHKLGPPPPPPEEQIGPKHNPERRIISGVRTASGERLRRPMDLADSISQSICGRR